LVNFFVARVEMKDSSVTWTKIMFSLYTYHFIRPHLDFGNSVIYYPVTKNNKRIIDNFQRRNTKLVPELRDLPYI